MTMAAIACLLLAAPDQAGPAEGGEQTRTVELPRIQRRREVPALPEGPTRGDRSTEESRSASISGSEAPGEALRELLSHRMTAEHARRVTDYFRDNLEELEGLASESGLDRLAVEDPVTYGVVTYLGLIGTLDRGQDREFLLHLLGHRDDPSYHEWVDAYARRILDGLAGDGTGTVAEAAEEHAGVTYRDGLSYRYGDESDDLTESIARAAGLAEEELESVRNLAGEVQLADERTGRIEVAFSDEGLVRLLAERSEEYSRRIEEAVDRLAEGGRDAESQDPPFEGIEEDRLPPEALPTPAELWRIASLGETERRFEIAALARAYARFAVGGAHERTRADLARMRAAALAERHRVAVDLLQANLDRQGTQIDGTESRAGPVLARINEAIAQAERRETLMREGARNRATLRADREVTAREPDRFGGFPRRAQNGGEADLPGDMSSGFGERLSEGMRRIPRTPLDEAARSGGAILPDGGDPFAAGGGIGRAVMLRCEVEDGRLVCYVELPGGGRYEVRFD